MARWAPSSVREVLRRSLSRGEVVFGKAKKRDASGAVIRSGDQTVGRPPGEGSPYLLVGLLRCGVCGGSMEVLSRKAARGQRVFEYRCAIARPKGAAICANNVPAPMSDTDAAVLAALERTLLNRAVVDRALAHAEARIMTDRTGEQRAGLEAQAAEVDAVIRRLTTAIASGGELAPLVAALAAAEARRREIEERLAAVRAPRPTFDIAAVREALTGYLVDWQKLLRGHVHQAQQIVRRLVKDRLTMVPQAAGFYTFTGVGTVRPLLVGVVRNLASPPRLAHIGGRLRRAA